MNNNDFKKEYQNIEKEKMNLQGYRVQILYNLLQKAKKLLFLSFLASVVFIIVISPMFLFIAAFGLMLHNKFKPKEPKPQPTFLPLKESIRGIKASKEIVLQNEQIISGEYKGKETVTPLKEEEKIQSFIYEATKPKEPKFFKNQTNKNQIATKVDSELIK